MNPQNNKMPFQVIPIRIETLSSQAVTFAAGAAGTLIDFVLPARPVLSAAGKGYGGKGDTSLSFVVGGTFDNEVAPNTRDEDLANGDYWINYPAGLGRGRKKDGGVADSVNLKTYSLATDVGVDLASLSAAIRNEGDTPTFEGKGMFILGVRDDAPSPRGADGEQVAFLFDEENGLWVREKNLAGAFDQSNSVIKSAPKPLVSGDHCWPVSETAALAASLVVKASAGCLRKVEGHIDLSAASDEYWLHVVNLTAVPGGAYGAGDLLVTKKVNHTTATDTPFSLDLEEMGLKCSVGIVLIISTTAYTKTVAGNVAHIRARWI